MLIPPELIHRLKNARHIAVLTGAGVSAESGVPTFRDAQTGLWAAFSPEELATPEAFARDPRLVWEWYAWRRKWVADARPNPGHHALAEWADLAPQFTLMTQNVDGLHQEVGSRDVIELHGNIHRTKCSVEGTVVELWQDTNPPPPLCPRCGAHLRPDVVWFHEPLPVKALELAFQAATDCDVFLSIGTSTIVYPAAQLPFDALEAGATVIEINPDRTPLTDRAHFALSGPAGQILPPWVNALRGLTSRFVP